MDQYLLQPASVQESRTWTLSNWNAETSLHDPKASGRSPPRTCPATGQVRGGDICPRQSWCRVAPTNADDVALRKISHDRQVKTTRLTMEGWVAHLLAMMGELTTLLANTIWLTSPWPRTRRPPAAGRRPRSTAAGCARGPIPGPGPIDPTRASREYLFHHRRRDPRRRMYCGCGASS